jgi:hypothetical protein
MIFPLSFISKESTALYSFLIEISRHHHLDLLPRMPQDPADASGDPCFDGDFWYIGTPDPRFSFIDWSRPPQPAFPNPRDVPPCHLAQIATSKLGYQFSSYITRPPMSETSSTSRSTVSLTVLILTTTRKKLPLSTS